MPGYATSSGDPSRGRPPGPVIVSGEVTKKKRDAKTTDPSQDAIPPPTFKGPKLLGAKSLLGSDPMVADAHMGDGELTPDTDLRTLASLRLGTTSSSEASTIVVDDDHKYRQFASPVGWRRFWGVVDMSYTEDPDIKLSPFCKSCYDSGDASLCDMTKRGTEPWGKSSRVSAKCDHCVAHDKCLFLITYQHDDAVPIDKLPTYKLRSLARQCKAAGEAGLEVLTSADHFTPVIKPILHAPAGPRAAKSQQGTSARVATPPSSSSSARLPTYSQARATYHDLKEWAVRRPPKKEGDTFIHERRHDRPTWVADIGRIGHGISRPTSSVSRIPQVTRRFFRSVVAVGATRGPDDNSDHHHYEEMSTNNGILLLTDEETRVISGSGNRTREAGETEAPTRRPVRANAQVIRRQTSRDRNDLRRNLLREMEKLCRLSVVEDLNAALSKACKITRPCQTRVSSHSSGSERIQMENSTRNGTSSLESFSDANYHNLLGHL